MQVDSRTKDTPAAPRFGDPLYIAQGSVAAKHDSLPGRAVAAGQGTPQLPRRAARQGHQREAVERQRRQNTQPLRTAAQQRRQAIDRHQALVRAVQLEVGQSWQVRLQARSQVSRLNCM